MTGLKKMLYVLDKAILKVEYLLVFFSTTMLIISVTLQVFTRYILSKPLRWTTEMCCFMLIYMVFIGSAIALRNGEHVAVDLSQIKMAKALRTGLNIAATISVYLFIAIMIFYGTKLSIANINSLSEAMKIPYGYIYMSVPISGVMMLIGYTACLLRKHDKEGTEV